MIWKIRSLSGIYDLPICKGLIGQDQLSESIEERLALVGLTPESVVQMDCLFRDVWNIPVMEKIIKERFGGKDGLQFQVDAVAYCG